MNTFDAYLQRQDIALHLARIPHFRGQSEHNVVTLIAATCIFISAKYLETTYPAIKQLLFYIGNAYSYEEFVDQEADILRTLDWRLTFVSIHDVLTHFLCQGVLFTSDRIEMVNGTTQEASLSQAHVLTYNIKIFEDLCLKKHEFLKYDRVILVCGIIMASRKVSNLCELWPEELVAMTGGRYRYPQVKKVMKHIVSFYENISCSITNSVTSSPQQTQTPIKRIAVATGSTKKMRRGGEKSQDQTTLKKTSGVGGVISNLSQGTATGGKENTSNNVITPNKNSMP